jgi:hypothetical protein
MDGWMDHYQLYTLPAQASQSLGGLHEQMDWSIAAHADHVVLSWDIMCLPCFHMVALLTLT